MKHFPTTDTSHMDAERRGKNIGPWIKAKPRLKVNWLCDSCNSGWMSRLENKAKPIFESIFSDNLRSINAVDQATLARWAVKTAMVLESINSDQSWFYSDDERQLMRIEQSIPMRTSVWIAKCINQPNIHSSSKNLWTSLSNDGFYAYVTTMAFGSIAFQVVSVKTPEIVPDNINVTYGVTEGPWDQTIIQIWPIIPKSIAWPPNYGLNGELGLYELAERLSPKKVSRGQ